MLPALLPTTLSNTFFTGTFRDGLFSTTLGFQGLENEIIIYLDPLEDYQKSFLSFANSDYEPQLFYSTFLETFNAMGRASTFLYILWDKKLENFYKNKLTLVSKIMITR